MTRDPMKGHMEMKRSLIAAVAVFCLAWVEETPAEVRSCILGIDINCPSGLAE